MFRHGERLTKLSEFHTKKAQVSGDLLRRQFSVGEGCGMRKGNRVYQGLKFIICIDKSDSKKYTFKI